MLPLDYESTSKCLIYPETPEYGHSAGTSANCLQMLLKACTALLQSRKTYHPKKASKSRLRVILLEGLLVAWLNELIFHFDTYGFLGKDIHINELRDTLITATVKGEAFDPERHGRGLLIKAATYHKLKIERKEDHWEADVIFDI